MAFAFARRRVRLIPLTLALLAVSIIAFVVAVHTITGAGKHRVQRDIAVHADFNSSIEALVQKPNSKQKSDVQSDDVDPTTTAYKRKFIRKMMSHAWNSYVEYAFGHSELAPISKRPHLTGVFGNSPSLGVTIVDALDTLWIMGLRQEFDRGRQWVAENFKLADADYNLSLFEINIRILGGLLSAFSLSGDEMFLQKAYEFGQTVLPAFSTPSGLPWPVYNFKRKQSAGSMTYLADVGTLHMEFAYLSAVTGNNVFLNHVNHIRDVLNNLSKKPNGFYRDHIDVTSGKWGYQHHTSVGSLGDSFYEYLFKSWLMTNRTDALAKKMYDEAMYAIEKGLVTATSGEGGKRQLVYFWQIDDYGSQQPRMDYTACFMGGLYALSAPYADDQAHYLLRAAQIADTCHFASISTRTGFAPELFGISGGNQVSIRSLVSSYLMRPEVLEAYFVLWRATRNPLYRKWGWAAAQAIEKHCRTENGYSGLRDVNRANPSVYDDVQPSYFLAETLKYLYLLFVDEEKPEAGGENSKRRTSAEDDGGIDISLDEYVFTTEAHPLPVSGSRRFSDLLELKIGKYGTNKLRV